MTSSAEEVRGKERVPEVDGRVLGCSIAEFEHRLRHYILKEQKEHRFDQDNGLLQLLCDAVRLSREFTDQASRPELREGEEELVAYRRAKDRIAEFKPHSFPLGNSENFAIKIIEEELSRALREKE